MTGLPLALGLAAGLALAARGPRAGSRISGWGLKRGFYRREGDYVRRKGDYVLLLGTSQGWTLGTCSLTCVTQDDLESTTYGWPGWKHSSLTSLELDAGVFERAGWKWVRPDSVPVVWRRFLTKDLTVVPLLSGRYLLQIPGRKKGLDLGRLGDPQTKPAKRGSRTELFVPDYFVDYDLDQAIRHHLDKRLTPRIPELDSRPEDLDDLNMGGVWSGAAEDVLFYLVVRNRMFLPFEDDLPRGMKMKTAFRRYVAGRGGPVRSTLRRLLAKVHLAPKDKVAAVKWDLSEDDVIWGWARKRHFVALIWEDPLGLRHVVGKRLGTVDGWTPIFWEGNVTLLAHPVGRGSSVRWVPNPKVPEYAKRGLHRSLEAAQAQANGLRPRTRLVQELQKAGVRDAKALVSHLHPAGWFMVGLYGRRTAYYDPAQLPRDAFDRLTAWRAR